MATDSDHYFAHMTVPPFSWPCLLLWDTEHRVEFPEVVGGVPSNMSYSETDMSSAVLGWSGSLNALYNPTL